MKITKIKDELKQLGTKELTERLDAMQRECFGLKLNTQVKDNSQFNKLKKNIARAQTYLRERELGESAQ